MGLDMYLRKQWYVGAHFKHREVTATGSIAVGSDTLGIDFSRVNTITENVAYWRKANQIHGWFVTNVQDGKDDCGEYYVEFAALMELKKLCEKILALQESGRAEEAGELIADKLPPCEGFFFGSSEVDEYYFGDLVETVAQLTGLTDDKHAGYYYQSSW